MISARLMLANEMHAIQWMDRWMDGWTDRWVMGMDLLTLFQHPSVFKISLIPLKYLES